MAINWLLPDFYYKYSTFNVHLMYIQSTFNVHGMYITRPFSRHRIVHKMNSCVLLSSLVFGLSLGTFFSSTWGVSAHTIITENRLNARRLAQELDGSHNPYETLKVCWEHASPLGLYPLRNETREGVRSMQHYNTMRARPFPPLHIMVSSQAISEETALCKWGNCEGCCTASYNVHLHSSGR